MNLIELKTSFCLLVMIIFIIMAFLTKDVSHSQLFAAVAILIGALATKYISPKNPKQDE